MGLAMTNLPASETPEVASLAEEVREKLEQLILGGEYLPGQRLNELSLSARIGVSRGTIREAVRSLEYARLVHIVPNRGVVVRKVDVPEALELYEVRAGLARTAGRLAAERATRIQLQSLAELYEKMEAAIDDNDPVTFSATNHLFHDSILSIASNARLQELDLSVRNEMQLYIRHGVLGEVQLKTSNQEHERILTALKARDANAAGLEFEQHILNGKQRMLENLRTGFGPRAA